MNQNVLPLPGSLSTPISPPISSTSRLQIASPRPVPPKRRLVEASAWENASNRRPSCSSVIPMPVSRTSKRTTRGEGWREARVRAIAHHSHS